MKTLYRLYEFLFDRWKITIEQQGIENRVKAFSTGISIPGSEFIRSFIDYKYTNKFDGSEKIVRKYLN